MRLRLVLLLLPVLLTLSSISAKAQSAESKPDPAKTRVWADFGDDIEAYIGVPFATYGPRKLTLDLYKPAGVEKGKRLPVIVAIFGGGWQNGSPAVFASLGTSLARKGFLVIVPTYRLSGEAPFPAAVHDCKAAIRWARAGGQMYGADPDKVAVIGGSAGGHLAAFMAATSGMSEFDGEGGNPDRPSTVQAAIVMCGPVNLLDDYMRDQLKNRPDHPIVAFMGGKLPSEAEDLYRQASPLTHVGKHTPPMLFIDGENDRPKARYPELWRKLDELGIHHEFKQMDGGPHPFWVYEQWHQDTVDVVSNFLHAQFAKK